MITINSISNAKYVRADNSLVELTIDTVELGIVPIGINLNDSDPEPHIVEIKNWIASHQGSISAYVAPAPIPAPVITKLSSLDYLNKFTTAEQEAIALATANNVQVKLFYDKMLAADFIDITDPLTIAGLDALVTAGLLTASRKTVILTP